MPDEQYKVCPRCGVSAWLDEPRCGRCGRVYQTRFPPQKHRLDLRGPLGMTGGILFAGALVALVLWRLLGWLLPALGRFVDGLTGLKF